ncbi:transposase [Streptomyces mirabilis]|uniref:transposase n=1 Tax=Streptomyces mirabilis TaxID=68239 RepID=UPI003687C59C
MIPVHDQKRTAKSKNYRRSVNVQIVCRARDRRVVAVAEAWPGNRNDVVVFRETLGRTLPDHPGLSGDGGYRGSDRIRTPRRGTNGRIVKDWNYRRFRKRRAVAEHGGGGVRCARAGGMHARTGAGARAAGGPAPGVRGAYPSGGWAGYAPEADSAGRTRVAGRGWLPGAGAVPSRCAGVGPVAEQGHSFSGVTPSADGTPPGVAVSPSADGTPRGVAVSAPEAGPGVPGALPLFREPGPQAPAGGRVPPRGREPGTRRPGPGTPDRGSGTRTGGRTPTPGGRAPAPGADARWPGAGVRDRGCRQVVNCGRRVAVSVGAGMEAISVATLRAASR